jgi:hypothetical protein
MPLTFTNKGDDPINPGYTLEDALDEEEVNFEAAFKEAEDEMNEESSVISASEYDLDAGELFDNLECRAISTLKSDHGKFHRVCGCRATDCTREGHPALRMTTQGRAPLKVPTNRFRPGSMLMEGSRLISPKLSSWQAWKLPRRNGAQGLLRRQQSSKVAPRFLKSWNIRKSGLLETRLPV